MTPQFNILTGLLSGMEDDGGLVLNYFHKASEDFVRENLSAAKEMYKKVFKVFLSAWYDSYTKGEIKHVPPPEWENLEI
jgi:hypothetical protein